jgi:4-amino-4-deoxy-L-arabinose transferase-like glycosyltransferase
MLRRYNTAIYFILGLFALLIGLAGQMLLTSSEPLSAAFLFALAVVLFVFAFRRQPGPQIQLAAPQLVAPGARFQREYVTGGLAIVSAILAFGLFGTSVSQVIPWLLHLTSIALLLVSVFRVDRAQRTGTSRGAAWSWLELGALLTIFTIAAFMRLYRFDQVPFGLWYDEAVYGSNALQILNTPNFLPIYAEQPMLPAHFIYLIALAFKILGASTLAIRAVSVVFGLGTVAAAYLTGKELFNRKMGLVLAFMLAVSRWDVNWSRIGMHGVTVPFFELLTVGLILRAFRRQRLMDYALAGLSLGFGLCFYFSFRIFPIVIGLFFLVLWLSRHDFVKSSWRGLILFGFSAVLAFLPVAQFALTQPDVFWSRVGNTSIFNDKTPEEGWRAAARTAQEHLLMFNYRGDSNGRHNLPGEPMLDPIIGTLFVLGIGLSLWRFRQPASFLLLAWLLVMLLPGIFSLDFESPQSLRAIGSLPAAYLLALVPIDALWHAWNQLPEQRAQSYYLIPLLVILGAVGYINYSIYFDRQATSSDSWAAFSTPETIAGKIMAERGNTVDYYVSTFYFDTPTIRFLAPDVTNAHRLETSDTLPVRTDSQKGLVFLIDADRKQFLQQAKDYYPSAIYQEFTAPNGTPILYEISLSPSDVQAVQGLTASYYNNDNWSGSPSLVRQEKNINFDWSDGDPVPFPASVEWNGVLLAPTYGAYRIVAHAPAPFEMNIDQVPVVFQNNGEQTADLTLAKGTHTLQIRTQGQPGHYELKWVPPAETETPIPPSAFVLPPITNNGLLARYYANGQWASPPAFTQIDPWINFYVQTIPLPRPYTVEWVGNINIPSDGHYLFGLESIDESALWIDEKLVLDDQTLNQYQEAGIDLAAGLHPIRVRFADRTGYTHINLSWTPPGGTREIIPQKVFFPPQGDPALIKPNTKN